MTSARGPKGRFLTGNLAEFRADRLAFFTRCARDYGDVVSFRLLGRPVIMLNRPDLVEQVLVTHAKNFVKHFGLRLYRPILGNGLVTSEGDLWRRQRKLGAPAFQASRLSAYADVMVNCAARMADEWQRDPAPRARDVHADMMRLTLEIACKTLFGADACPDPNVVGRALEEGLEGIAARFRLTVPLPAWLPTPANWRLRRSLRTLHAVVADLVAGRRAAMARDGGGDDLLSMLLSARDEQGRAMSDEQLLDEVLTLLLAGHETAALALSYALHLLALHPDAQAALRAEHSHLLAGRLPTDADLPRL